MASDSPASGGGTSDTTAGDFLPDEGLPSSSDILALLKTAVSAPVLAVFSALTAYWIAARRAYERIAENIVGGIETLGGAVVPVEVVEAGFRAPNIAASGILAYVLGILTVGVSIYVVSWGVSKVVE